MDGSSSPDQQTLLRTLSLISPLGVLGARKRRVGGAADGGYVMIDDPVAAAVCYSLGVGPDVSWDLEMARRGALVFQYDHTIEDPPSAHPGFRYFPVGITHDDQLAPNLRRLDTLIASNGHDGHRDMILKVDIEGHEWDSLDALPESVFLQFRQIVCEFHGLRMLSLDSFHERARRLFLKLSRTHRPVHVHGNNFAAMAVIAGIAIPDVIELTLASKENYNFGPNRDLYPTLMDAACNSEAPDLYLGSFQF